MPNIENVEEYWTKKASDVLLGKTVKEVFYMSEKEAQEWDWYRRPLVIVFTDGTEIVISQDDEGNGPGSIFTSNPDVPTIPSI